MISDFFGCLGCFGYIIGAAIILVGGIGICFTTGLSLSEGLTVWHQIVLIGAGIIVFLRAIEIIKSNIREKKQAEQLARQAAERNKWEEEERNREQEYKENAINIMKSLGCNPEKILWDEEFSLGIDYENKNICVTSKYPRKREPYKAKLYDSKDILKVEFNQASKVTGGGGHITVYDTGGGGSIAPVSSETTYSVKIIVNDHDNPTYTANFDTDRKTADYWYGILTAITVN